MLLSLYRGLWGLVLPFLAGSLRSRGGEAFAEKLGMNLPGPPPGRGSLWVHALSVGEVLSALPLLRRLRECHPQKGLVLTVKTRKGMEVAREKTKDLGISALVPMPLDAPGPVARLLSWVEPSLLVLVETDLWPGLLGALQQRKVPRILVNGRISPRTFRMYMRVPFLARRLFSSLDLCLMQTDLDRRRLLRAGVGRVTPVRTVGNIKFDQAWHPLAREERRAWWETLGLPETARIWVAGSVHPGEKHAVLGAFRRLRSGFPELRLILAPRDVADGFEFQAACTERGLNAVLRSEPEALRTPWDVLVLDSLGELARLYGLGEVSFVGGSLTPQGGHNLLEPSSLGVPVIFGPYTHNFEEMAHTLLSWGGGLRIRNEEGLFCAVRDLFEDPGRRKEMGSAALAFVKANQGALDRVMEYLDLFLGVGGAR